MFDQIYNHLVAWIQANPATTSFIALAIVSNLIQMLPKPTETSGPQYRIFYRLSHFAALNWKYAFLKKFPDYKPPVPLEAVTAEEEPEQAELFAKPESK